MTQAVKLTPENLHTDTENANEMDPLSILVAGVLANISNPDESPEIRWLFTELTKFQKGHSCNIERIKNLREIGKSASSLDKELGTIVYKETEEACSSEIESNPTPEAYFEMALICDQLGKYAEKNYWLNRVIEVSDADPNNEKKLFLKARAIYEFGDKKGAANCLRYLADLIESDPESSHKGDLNEIHNSIEKLETNVV